MDPRIPIIAAESGGVLSRRHLLRIGVDPVELATLRRTGTITVLRRGWYATTTARPTVIAAVRSGAVVTCVSALEYTAGLWVPPGIARMHLRWPRHTPVAARSHPSCRSHRPLPMPLRAVDSLPVALQCAANCLPSDEFIAVLDSTLRMPRPYTESVLAEIFVGASRRVLRLVGLVDPAAGSGTESLVRYRLVCAGIRVRSQVTIRGVGRVDLLVGDKLIIECDSEGYHGGAQRRSDNRRDRTATIGDYRVLRIDYADVLYDWDATLHDILAIVRSGRHRGRTRF
ncbi:type IV toxin-antitoxin system AbiEi family antitoxin domain-containing protein [Tsukamurella ocularis]|uniref:type IV toxin-antitoxin system AbiEi family antitoxin domain-containing protein n=1 Tax=Tsukamurella ocularis TaxID=1970234 RepID=UPI00216942A5|nr:type IV toxin-antitoxin system AbiEi family antitoxin domain-containing protein [Tsukamurella ocularis]MCS3781193.1 very-short-patch-repair endonuclease [Tsukamurella ocularis]MCS3787017.1 very-short-patch-repair endonuclease [Tsukamurella ocularis]MCS3850859.1 very-short-patch-repair endonuclease [Tsukamurella ocularis]